MSDFVDMILSFMPSNSSLRNPNNEFRKFLDRSLGAWFDEHSEIYEQFFITTATGKWLDLHGKDLNVPRKQNESDDEYRERLVFEKLEYLTTSNLQNIYGLTLYVFVNDFDATVNCLTSDNPYISSRYMSFASDELKEILNKKFVLEGGIEWL